VPVAQTDVQATGTAAVPRVTGTSDTAAVSLGSALINCFKVKKLRLNSKQNYCNAEKLLSFVAPSGDQELT